MTKDICRGAKAWDRPEDLGAETSLGVNKATTVNIVSKKIKSVFLTVSFFIARPNASQEIPFGPA